MPTARLKPQLSLFAEPEPVAVAWSPNPTPPAPVVLAATNRYRLVRNNEMQVYVAGKTDPFAPWFDVEGVDETWMPVCVIASGVDAPTARKIIARVGGIEVNYLP